MIYYHVYAVGHFGRHQEPLPSPEAGLVEGFTLSLPKGLFNFGFGD
jgi:hypothetical protein